VDYVFHDEQIALTPETEAWFYSADAVRLPEYRRGRRRFLEQVVEETTQGCATDRARAMALVRLIGNPETSPYRHRDLKWTPFLGGTEEEVLKKGWRMCNEISRVLAFLCQIAGMPARCLFLFTDPLTRVDGHAMTEIFFDGKWNLIEQNLGLLYLMPDGYFASAVEMRDRPEIVNARADVGGGLALCHACFTGPISIIPYDIDRTERYRYPWQTLESL
jgi:transglutaminase-like putative cysteine protease